MSARNRIVLAQGAVAIVVAAWALGRAWAFAALPLALFLLALAIARIRRRPLARWAGDGIRYLERRRSLPGGAGGAALLALIRPGATASTIDVDGADVGVLEDTDGLAAIVRIGDLSELFGTALPPLPPLDALLPAPTRDVPEVRVQLLVSAVAAPPPTTTSSAASYRQLTDGRALAHQRVLVTVRVRRAGGFQRADLERSLTVAVRRVSRLLTKSGLPARPLSAVSALAALAEAAQHDPAEPVLETWTGVQVGGLHQAVFRLRRWSEQEALVNRLLLLPSWVTTVSLTAQPCVPGAGGPAAAAAMHAGVPARRSGLEDHRVVKAYAARGSDFRAADWNGGHGGGPEGDGAQLAAGAYQAFGSLSAAAVGGAVRAEIVVRVAAPSAAALARAGAAVERLAENMGAQAERLDGAHLDGLAATLPLGGGAADGDAVLAGLVAGVDGLAVGGGQPVSLSSERLAGVEPAIGGEGVVLGVDQQGEPVVVRLFRSEPTRALLIGGRRCAQLIVVRALAMGARVVVQSAWPHAWEPFRRGLGRFEALAVVPTGRLEEPPPAQANRPQLLVVDVGAVPGEDAPVPESAWRTVLFVRDELTAADVDLLARVDLTLLQGLRPGEAALVRSALRLVDSRGWLTEVGPEMLGVMANRQWMRWARLSATPIELELMGGPAR